jgi:hypothetical protein
MSEFIINSMSRLSMRHEEPEPVAVASAGVPYRPVHRTLVLDAIRGLNLKDDWGCSLAAIVQYVKEQSVSGYSMTSDIEAVVRGALHLMIENEDILRYNVNPAYTPDGQMKDRCKMPHGSCPCKGSDKLQVILKDKKKCHDTIRETIRRLMEEDAWLYCANRREPPANSRAKLRKTGYARGPRKANSMNNH